MMMMMCPKNATETSIQEKHHLWSSTSSLEFHQQLAGSNNHQMDNNNTSNTSNASGAKPFLYVSSYCRHCEKVVAFLQRNALQDRFAIVNVDDAASAEAVPQYVTHVPCLLVMNHPNSHMVLVGTNLQKFLDRYATRHKQQANQANNHVVEPSCIGGKCEYGFLDDYRDLDRPEQALDSSFGAFNPNGASEGGMLLMSEQAVGEAQKANRVKVDKASDEDLDKLLSQRNQDLQGLFSSSSSSK